MGSLSHYINVRAAGYHDLPEFPEEAPSSAERNVPEPAPAANPNSAATQDMFYPRETPQAQQKPSKKKKSFYSESDSSPPDGKL